MPNTPKGGDAWLKIRYSCKTEHIRHPTNHKIRRSKHIAAKSTEKLIKEWYDAWNSRDGDKVSSLYTDDCIYEDKGGGRVYHGKQEVSGAVKQMTTSFPDFKLELKSMVNAGNWSASEWVIAGTFAHSFIPTIPATGKSFSARGASICELYNDKIRRHTDYWKMADFLQQVGLMPAPAK